MIQVSGTHFGVEPAENPPKLKRMLLPLVGGEIERHSLAVAATLARAAHMEVLLLAADSTITDETARSRRFRLSAWTTRPTLHAVSRNLARHEAELRGRGVRARSYLMRGATGDTVALLRRVAAQEHTSMLVLTTGPRAALGFPQAVRAALSIATPTMLVSTAAASPFTHDVLRSTSVIVPTYGDQNATEGLLWAEALAKCCDGTIVLLRMGRVGSAAVPAQTNLPDEASGNPRRGVTGKSEVGHVYWRASGVSIRAESVSDFGGTLAHLRLQGPVLVVLPIAPAQFDEGASQVMLRALDASDVLTLVIPCGVPPSEVNSDDETKRTASEEESYHDATTHA
jgi:hypothetical protein